MNGILRLVSVGPGFSELIPPLAEQALKQSDVIVAYELYLRWIQPWISGKEIYTPPLTQERERALLAIEQARAGRRVALVSSGDIGIYAMAALAFDEMREDDTFAVKVVPGITSANASASLLGSPLSHDFATLSLSDLLCPWQWIEQRAQHIAQADLAAVLYNVQSQGRQEGVYDILRIMLEHKRADTWCGVVRNAYRPEQHVSIFTLKELLGQQFDMLTTIVIGNRYTRRKRDWIYTPRGYNAWDTDADTAPNLPHRAAWVFSGTSDGNALANRISANGNATVVSTATDYGADVASNSCPGVVVLSGRRGVETRRRDLAQHHAKIIVDATHPYATQISQQLMALAQELSIPYIRFERPSLLHADEIETCDSMQTAAQRAMQQGKRIFLATGSKDLAVFINAKGAQQCSWFTRLTPEIQFIQRAIDLGIPRARICAMQGPFSQALNEALWRDWKIDCVVTKDSGEAGGYRAKAQAAEALGIPMLIVKRPQLDYPVLANDFDSVITRINTLSR